MKVEVALAYDHQEILIEIDLPLHSTLADAIHVSGIKEKIPEFFQQFPQYKTGIFGKLYEKSHILLEGDRVEIYRPLLIDTQSRRFHKVRQQRKVRAQKK